MAELDSQPVIDGELRKRVRGVNRYTRANQSSGLPAAQYRGLEIVGIDASLHEKIAEYALAYLPSGSEILDVGCGSGALCARLSDSGFSPTGCDALSESFKLHGQIPFFPVDLNSDFSETIPGKFDAISATEIIEHLDNPRHFLLQCRKLLKDSGKIFITTPNIDSPMAKAYYVRTGTFWMFSDEYYNGVGHITPISRWLLLKALGEVGFQVLRVDSLADWGSFFDWWKMRMIAWAFKRMAATADEQGKILAVAAGLKN